jgi:hypothetical protein
MNDDVDVEDIGFDAERIDDVVAAYDAVEDHEDHADDFFTISAVMKKIMLMQM